VKIISVIVCFHPDCENVTRLIDSLALSGVSSIVVDNSDSVNLFSASHSFEYIFIGENLGIAEAQNRGIQLAFSGDAAAVIFFDQDSRINDRFIGTLVEPLTRGDEDIVAPIFKSIKYGFFYDIVRSLPSGRREKITPTVGNDFYTNIAISSGTVVTKSVIDKVGLMKPDLFIDYVDTEWCLRASALGFRIYINTNAVMEHEIGDEIIRLGNFNVPVHSAFRRYYRIRNSFLLFRYSHVPTLLAVREISVSVAHQFFLIIFCKDKFNYVKSLYEGTRDGLLKLVRNEPK
jgi:rhamnosyltransferase